MTLAKLVLFTHGKWRGVCVCVFGGGGGCKFLTCLHMVQNMQETDCMLNGGRPVKKAVKAFMEIVYFGLNTSALL